MPNATLYRMEVLHMLLSMMLILKMAAISIVFRCQEKSNEGRCEKGMLCRFKTIRCDTKTITLTTNIFNWGGTAAAAAVPAAITIKVF